MTKSKKSVASQKKCTVPITTIHLSLKTHHRQYIKELKFRLENELGRIVHVSEIVEMLLDIMIDSSELDRSRIRKMK